MLKMHPGSLERMIELQDGLNAILETKRYGRAFSLLVCADCSIVFSGMRRGESQDICHSYV